MGITPTNDKKIIKKAYAKAAKLHHPEDDPEGFQKVKQAYEQALSYAEYAADWADEEQEECSESESEKEEKASNDSEIDYSVIANRDSEQGTDEKPQPEYNFDESIEQGNREREEYIQHCFENVMRNYYSSKRNSITSWRAYFKSHEFRSLQADAIFTEKFLSFFADHREFKWLVWKIAFKPLFREWSFMWTESKYKDLFKCVCRPIHELPKGCKFQGTRAEKYIGLAFTIFMVLFVTMCATGAFGRIGDWVKAQQAYHSSSSQRIIPPGATEKYNSLLYITEGIIAGKDYAQMREDCLTAKISENEYHNFVRIYLSKGESNFRIYMQNYEISILNGIDPESDNESVNAYIT